MASARRIRIPPRPHPPCWSSNPDISIQTSNHRVWIIERDRVQPRSIQLAFHLPMRDSRLLAVTRCRFCPHRGLGLLLLLLLLLFLLLLGAELARQNDREDTEEDGECGQRHHQAFARATVVAFFPLEAPM